MTKVCTKCKIERGKKEFYKNAGSKHGFATMCIHCISECGKQYRLKYKNIIKIRNKRWRKKNKEHLKKINKQWRLKNPDAVYNRRLVSVYHITPEKYQSLLQAQDGKCAICKISLIDWVERFAVDHDHKCCPPRTSCGKCIRGLLCGNCNKGLGNLQDSIDILTNAIQYLKLTSIKE